MSIIKKLRESRGISQARLAELSGTVQSQIYNIEKGTRPLSKQWAERIAPHLGVTPQELMFGESDIEPHLPIQEEKEMQYVSAETRARKIADIVDVLSKLSNGMLDQALKIMKSLEVMANKADDQE